MKKGICCAPERPVKTGRELGGVAHQRDVGQALGLERVLYGANAAVHHVRGGDHLGASLGVGHSDLR